MNRILRVLATLILAFSFGSASANLLLEENFEYPIGTLPMENGGWYTQWGGASSLAIADGLTFEGYPGSGVGNGVEIAVDDSDASHHQFAEVTSGDVYVAFMFRPFMAYKKGYFFCLRDSKVTPGDFNFNGRVSVEADGRLGLTFANNKNAQYTTEALDGNKTYLMVLKYSIKEGYNNDEVSLYCMETLQETEPAQPVLGPLSDAAKTDINPANVVLRGFASSDYISLMVDGIRVATTWEEAVGKKGGVEVVNKTGNSIACVAGKVILSAETASNYRVCDMLGCTLYSGRVNAEQVALDLRKGVYVVKLGDLTRKIIIR